MLFESARGAGFRLTSVVSPCYLSFHGPMNPQQSVAPQTRAAVLSITTTRRAAVRGIVRSPLTISRGLTRRGACTAAERSYHDSGPHVEVVYGVPYSLIPTALIRL